MSITTAFITCFLIDGVAYRARLFTMPFHVSENDRMRAHVIGCPDMPSNGVHVLAGWLKKCVLPEGVDLVMADRLFSHGVVEQQSGTDGARAVKVLSQVALGSESSHRLWRNTVTSGFRDEIVFFLDVAFVQADTTADDTRLLGDLIPVAERSSTADAALTMIGLHLYHPDEPETLVDCALPAPSWTEAAVGHVDGYRALVLLHPFIEDDGVIHVDIELLPSGQVVL